MPELWTTTLVKQLSVSFEAHADEARAEQMARYMKDKFTFFGIDATARRALQREVLRGAPKPTEGELSRIAKGCWKRRERELHYFGADCIRAHVNTCSDGSLDLLEYLITTKSWWDTVDLLASHGVGPLALRYRSVRDSMDVWIASDDVWVARAALLHQLTYKEQTDARKLFEYCRLRMRDEDFFLRKAIGWALREYSKTDPNAVRRFVEDNAGSLSGLSTREALRWLTRTTCAKSRL